MIYCENCLFQEINPIPISFNREGVCTGCIHSFDKYKVNWAERESKFLELIEKYKRKSLYDCIVPVSGGKDSYFAAHIAKKFNLNALLVTYYSKRYLPEGDYNLKRMKEIFGFDHLIFSPPDDVLIKMHRIGLIKMGDNNMHNHMGISTFPNIIAVEKKVPLILWGDQGFTEQGGMHSINDFVEYTEKYRFEHDQHGFDWYDFINIQEDYLEKKDLYSFVYPDENDLRDIGVRGVYLSNYFFYDGNENYKIAKNLYGWKEAQKVFERTYRTFSNVDDMHENGIHDYLKFIKFGFGRGTDHANYDIRLNMISREDGIKIVLKYDHVIPSDLNSWLDYVKMTEEQFYKYANKFRDPRVWTKEKNLWSKIDIDGVRRIYK